MKLTIATYCIIALATFGYAATNPRTTIHREPDLGAASTFAAIVWPLYWSWEIADLGRAALASKGE